MSATSDTPRTDDLARGNHVVPTEWAEDLERELNAAQKIIRQQQLMDEEMLALKERINRLEDAGQLLRDADEIEDLLFAQNAWDNAMEAKP